MSIGRSRNQLNIKAEINDKKIYDKVNNDELGKEVSFEWKRLIDPYTPRDIGRLEENVEPLPFAIHYKQPYSVYTYYGYNMDFQKNNPYSTYEWDIAAAESGQLDKLNRIINNYLNKN